MRKEYNSFWFYESQAAKARAGFKCAWCGAQFSNYKKGELITHHIDEKKKNDLHSNLVVVCKWCHRKYHRRFHYRTFSYGGMP